MPDLVALTAERDRVRAFLARGGGAPYRPRDDRSTVGIDREEHRSAMIFAERAGQVAHPEGCRCCRDCQREQAAPQDGGR